MPAVISHKAVEESCNYRKGLHKLCFRVKAAHSASQGSAEVASSPKPWGLKLFQADVRNEMHTCVHGRDTESPSCAGSPSVSSSVSQHSRPFTVHHTAAHDPHTHQPIKERGRAQNRHFVSRLWLHTKAIIDLFSLKNKSFFMKSRALSSCPPESFYTWRNLLHQEFLLHWPFPAALSDLLVIKEDSWIMLQFVVPWTPLSWRLRTSVTLFTTASGKCHFQVLIHVCVISSWHRAAGGSCLCVPIVCTSRVGIPDSVKLIYWYGCNTLLDQEVAWCHVWACRSPSPVSSDVLLFVSEAEKPAAAAAAAAELSESNLWPTNPACPPAPENLSAAGTF